MHKCTLMALRVEKMSDVAAYDKSTIITMLCDIMGFIIFAKHCMYTHNLYGSIIFGCFLSFYSCVSFLMK